MYIFTNEQVKAEYAKHYPNDRQIRSKNRMLERMEKAGYIVVQRCHVSETAHLTEEKLQEITKNFQENEIGGPDTPANLEIYVPEESQEAFDKLREDPEHYLKNLVTIPEPEVEYEFEVIDDAVWKKEQTLARLKKLKKQSAAPTVAKVKLPKKCAAKRCKSIAYTKKEIEIFFGWRLMGGVQRPQSYCRLCR